MVGITLVIVPAITITIHETEVAWSESGLVTQKMWVDQQSGQWISPTECSTKSSKWANVEKAYDGDVDTKAKCYELEKYEWSPFLEFMIPSTMCGKVRIYAPCSFSYQSTVDIDIYRNDTWVNIYDGPIDNRDWTEKGFAPGDVSKARVRFYIGYHGTSAEINEFDFYDIGGGVNHIEVNKPDSQDEETPPDIYYIIMDRYASADVLEEYYHFDNSEFLNFLTDKGFYVASDSQANYLKTRSSLASSLNFNYINYLTEELGEDYKDLGPIHALLEDYEVWRFLKSQGYLFVHFGSWWGPTGGNKYADMNIIYSYTPEFTRILFETTPLFPLLDKLNIFEVDDFDETHAKRFLYKFDKLHEISELEEPTFVFAHMLVPHVPCVFDAECNYVENGRSRVNYVSGLICGNKKLKDFINDLLEDSEQHPIIILQSDEGPFPSGMRNDGWEDATEDQLRKKMGILNAYYLPGVDTSGLYSSISPVNSFRVVFNEYFGTDLELLPDKSYVYYTDHPYQFLDVTDIVVKNQE